MKTAKFFPDDLSDEIRNDPKRSAEVKVYDALKASPHIPGFTVFYSLDWIGVHNAIVSDGEADFIIAHPDLGFLSIEVKGGRISREVSTDRWRSKDRTGEFHDISNPIKQAMKSKKVLLRAIQDRWQGESAPWIRARHGVIFPDSSKPDAPERLGAAMPLDLIAFKEDLGLIGARLIKMLTWDPAGANERPGTLGDQGISILKDLYGRDFELRSDLISDLDELEAKFIELTQLQLRVLDQLQLQTSALVMGGAGTGKTVLAMEKAKRLASEGKSVLLLCFNKPLSLDLKRKLEGIECIEACTFHSFCEQVASNAGYNLKRERRGKPKEQYFGDVLPQLLKDSVSEIKKQFDAIIIDEGQDFETDWYHILRRYLADQNDSVFYVFADSNQSIYKRDTIEDALSLSPFLLTENIRNTRQIFDVIDPFYGGFKQSSIGPEGPNVRWIECNEEEQQDCVENILNEIVLGEGIPSARVAILTGRAVDKTPFGKGSNLGEHHFSNASDALVDCVVADSVYRFKGLDREVVIVTSIDDLSGEPELPYVALSRAKELLFVVAEPNTIALLKAYNGTVR